ncbi:MAG: acetyltransferase, partial [Planifilum sp.]
MRRTTRYPVSGSNSLWQMYRTVPFWKVFKNVIVIQ